jgi:hypothetical protein
MSTWSSKVKVLMVLVAVAITGMVVAVMVPFLWGEPEAQASASARGEIEPVRMPDIGAEMDAWEERFEAEMARGREESKRLSEELARQPRATRPKRSVRRWVWESPAETRASLWHVPDDETAEAVITGMLRICTMEAEGLEDDCIGIWQVINNIRIRSCNREMYRHITECDEDGETTLSVMRRAQRFALSVVPPRSLRSRWIAEMETSCDQPTSYPEPAETWDRNHRRYCERTVELVRTLVAGDYERITGSRIIAWGGRCEDETGACDDRMACSRGLARVTELETANAFWCQPGSTGCSDAVDPICGRYAPAPATVAVVEAAEANGIDEL